MLSSYKLWSKSSWNCCVLCCSSILSVSYILFFFDKIFRFIYDMSDVVLDQFVFCSVTLWFGQTVPENTPSYLICLNLRPWCISWCWPFSTQHFFSFWLVCKKFQISRTKNPRNKSKHIPEILRTILSGNNKIKCPY